MTVTLSPIIIYPDDYGTVRPGGLEAPFPALMIARAITERSDAYARGHWREMVALHLPKMRYTRPTPYILDDFIIRELKAGSEADGVMLNNLSISSNQAWTQSFEATKANLDVTQMASPIEFSGGNFTPLRAIAHWIFGKGQQAKVNIKNIGISPTLQKTPQLKSAVDAAITGTSRIDITFPYNTGMDSNISRIYLGTITLRVAGDLMKGPDGSVSFQGAVRAFSDRYDADASSHRGGFDEAATTALREVGRIASAQNYEILIEGEIPITLKQ